MTEFFRAVEAPAPTAIPVGAAIGRPLPQLETEQADERCSPLQSLIRIVGATHESPVSLIEHPQLAGDS